jgi:hypothetical protein
MNSSRAYDKGISASPPKEKMHIPQNMQHYMTAVNQK